MRYPCLDDHKPKQQSSTCVNNLAIFIRSIISPYFKHQKFTIFVLLCSRCRAVFSNLIKSHLEMRHLTVISPPRSFLFYCSSQHTASSNTTLQPRLLHQLIKQPPRFHQIPRTIKLRHSPLLEHHNPITIQNRIYPMRDSDYGAFAKQRRA